MAKFNLPEEPKILIIDDMEGNVILLKKMLTMHGYQQVESLTDPRLTLDICKAYRPHLLLLNLRISNINGLEVLEQLKNQKETEHQLVIVITEDNDRGNAIKALERGAIDYIEKPFEAAEVLIRIHNILEHHMLSKHVYEQNVLLEQKVAERTKILEQTQIELFERLMRAAEFRDNDTGMHISRIGQYVYQMALLKGIPEPAAKQYLYASMMHDIGKIGIPDDILLKPEKFTDMEFNIMKLHTVKGSAILAGSNLEVLRLAEQIALTHHERWDGLGYPLGLSGEAIPLGGRITALFDVYDALISKRPYKDPWPEDKALEEIRRLSGSAFDPELVSLFFDNLSLFLTSIRK